MDFNIDWEKVKGVFSPKPKRKMTDTETQLMIILLALAAALLIFGYFTQGISNNSLFKNFSGSGIINFSISSNIPIPKKVTNAANLLIFKSSALAFANSYYNQLFQIELAVSVALLGLYALIFIEIIKSVNERVFKNKNIPEWIKYLIIFIAILPFALLLAGMANMLASFVLYQNLYTSATSFLALSNYSISSNLTVNFSLTAKTYTNNTIQITYSALFNAFNNFPNVANSSLLDLIYCIRILLAVLILFAIYIALSRPINMNDEIMKQSQVIGNPNPPDKDQKAD